MLEVQYECTILIDTFLVNRKGRNDFKTRASELVICCGLSNYYSPGIVIVCYAFLRYSVEGTVPICYK